MSRYFVNTAPAYALMLMLWCSYLLLNFAYAYAYALVKTSLNAAALYPEESVSKINLVTQLTTQQIQSKQ